MFKKPISLLLSSLMVFSIVIPTNTFGASKDYSGHWAEETIQSWLTNNYCTGYPDGSFRAEETVTRAEYVKMVNTLFGYTELTDISFIDVNPGDWYYQEVQKAVKANYITGVSKTKFSPNERLTREQAAVIISKIMKLNANPAGVEGFSDKDKISNWSKGYVGAVVAAGLFSGYDTGKSFGPQNSIKRAEAIVSLDRTKKLKNESNVSNKEITGIKETNKHKHSVTSVTSISAISGTPKVGVALTAGILAPAEATVNYQWKICGTIDGEYTNIPAATTNKYIPVEADVNKYIKVSAIGTGNYAGTVTSTPTTAVAPIKTYTVTFDSTSGTAVTAITGVASGATITLPTAPTKTWYTFSGWNTAADGSGTAFDSSTKVTADVTVYAQWAAETTIVKFPDSGTAYIGFEDLPDGGDMDYEDVGMNMYLQETYEGGVLRKAVLEYKLLYHGAGYNHLVHINRPLNGSYTYTIDRDIVVPNAETAEATSVSSSGAFDVVLFDTSDATPRTIKIEINFDATNTANTLLDYNVADARFDLDKVFKLYDPWLKITNSGGATVPDVHIRNMMNVPAFAGHYEAFKAPCIIVVPVTNWYTSHKFITSSYPDFDDYYRTMDQQYANWYN